ncbi:MAG: DUF3775 domain-containing protein [Acidobacteriota bacterium]|nr:DUF3775 domain-containing protein [Acidobacteriota bacterium]
MGHLQTEPKVKAYNTYVTNLPDEETAELIALTWLGRNYDHTPDAFDTLVDTALIDKPRVLFTEPKQKLPQYLRLGMERLARFQTGKKVAKPIDEDRRLLLMGKFVREQFEKTYGREHGRHKLLSMMEDAGYLEQKEDRKLFGLPAEKGDDALHTVLSGKRESARIRLGTIRKDD